MTTAKANHAKIQTQLASAVRREAPIATIRSLQSLLTFWAARCVG